MEIPKEEPKQTDWKDSTKALMEAYGDSPKDFPYEEPKQDIIMELEKDPSLKEFDNRVSKNLYILKNKKHFKILLKTMQQTNKTKKLQNFI